MSRTAEPTSFFSLAALLSMALASCSTNGDETALSKLGEATDEDIANVPVPPADGPKLGALADVTPVVDRPAKGATQIGYLHAGAEVARAEEAYSKKDCDGGWYPVRPRGFVCNGEVATTDLQHPTLIAMALQPRVDQPLPYTYARARKSTAIFERDPDKQDAVRPVGKLRGKSGLAIVGSWSATTPEGVVERLGMMTNGQFVKAADLEAAQPSKFQGVELGEDIDLPLGFVVKRGVRSWQVEKGEAEKAKLFDYHEILHLTGRFREAKNLKYWALADGRYARHRDVTVIRRRNVFPDFATGDQRWIDVSIITGTMVLYEGKKPVFATLVSVGRDRLGDPKETASTVQGTLTVASKHVTAAKLDPKAVAQFFDIYDVPWAMELSSGQLIHGSFWHNRFGIEHTPGNIELSPADAVRVWRWVTPPVPEGWHGVNQVPEGAQKTLVRIRK